MDGALHFPHQRNLFALRRDSTQLFCDVARLTGLEPATPGVTGRYSNQLSYNPASPPGITRTSGGITERGGRRQAPVEEKDVVIAVVGAGMKRC